MEITLAKLIRMLALSGIKPRDFLFTCGRIYISDDNTTCRSWVRLSVNIIKKKFKFLVEIYWCCYTEVITSENRCVNSIVCEYRGSVPLASLWPQCLLGKQCKFVHGNNFPRQVRTVQYWGEYETY